MKETDVLKPISAYKQDTWDALDPRAYAERMFPHGQPRAMPPKWRLKLEGSLNPWGVALAWRQGVAGSGTWDFQRKEVEVHDRPKIDLRRADGSLVALTLHPKLDASSLVGFQSCRDYVTVEELARKERRRIQRFAIRQRALMEKFQAKQAKLERKWNARKAFTLAKWRKQWSETILKRGFNTVDDAIRHFQVNQLDFDLSTGFGRFLKRYWDYSQREFTRKAFRPNKYTFRYYDPFTHQALQPCVIASRRKMTQMLPVVHESTRISARPWSFTCKQVIDSGMDETLVVRDVHETTGHFLPQLYTLPTLRQLSAQPNPPSFDEEKLQYAINRLLKRNIDVLADLPLFVCEWRDLVTNVTTVVQSIQSLRDLLAKAFDGESALLNRNQAWRSSWIRLKRRFQYTVVEKPWWSCKQTVEELWSIFKDLGTLYSNVDLWLKFGIKPTLRDFSGISETLNGASSIWQKLNKIWLNSGKERRFSTTFDNEEEVDSHEHALMADLPPCPFWGYWSRYLYVFDEADRPRVRVTHKLSYRDRVTILASCTPTDFDGNELSWDETMKRGILDALGLYLSPKLAWDLLPYSFVVDWFCNISKFLDQFSVRNLALKWKVAACCLTRTEEVTTTLTSAGPRQAKRIRPSGTAVGSETTTYQLESPTVVISQKRFTRVLRDPLRIGAEYELPALSRGSWFALETGTELLCGLFRG